MPITRIIECRGGECWQVRAAGRPSAFRIDLVFSRRDPPAALYRLEVEGQSLAAFSDDELCWFLEQAKEAG